MFSGRPNYYANSPEELPVGEHWAILTGSSVLIPGDLRSQTNPGHGFPAHTEYSITYHVFLNEDEFKVALAKALNSGFASNKVRGIHVKAQYVGKNIIQLQEQG